VVLLISDNKGFRICESLKKYCSRSCPFMEDMERTSRNVQKLTFFMAVVMGVI